MKEKRDFSVRRLAVRRSERKKESPAPFEMTSEGEKQKKQGVALGGGDGRKGKMVS
jgi:hypothetical protein